MKPSITVSRHLQRCVRLTPAAQPATLRNNLLRNVNKSRIHAPKRPYTTSQVHKQPPAPSPSIRQRLVKYGARSLFIGLCFQLGFSFGTWSDEIPEPMTEEDEDELAFIDAEFLSLPGVEEFYNNPQSYECPVQFGSTRGAKHRIEHAFEGSRGWSFLRSFRVFNSNVFHHYIMLGRSMCGWPNTIHGGAIATVLQDLAFQSALFQMYPEHACFQPIDPSSNSVLDASDDRLDFVDCADFDIIYSKPVKPDDFYTVSVFPVYLARCGPEHGKDLPEGTGILVIQLLLSDAVTRVPHAEARSTFYVPDIQQKDIDAFQNRSI